MNDSTRRISAKKVKHHYVQAEELRNQAIKKSKLKQSKTKIQDIAQLGIRTYRHPSNCVTDQHGEIARES